MSQHLECLDAALDAQDGSRPSPGPLRRTLRLTRRWPYGTTKEVEVLAFIRNVVIRNEEVDQLVVRESTSAEAFVVSASAGSDSEAQPGDLGIITFREGGPTGGHWTYTGIVKKSH